MPSTQPPYKLCVACMQLDVTKGQSCAFPRIDNARLDFHKNGCRTPYIYYGGRAYAWVYKSNSLEERSNRPGRVSTKRRPPYR